MAIALATGTRASAPTKKMTLAQGHIMRVTREDNCGRIVYGDNAFAVSEGFVSVAATATTTEVAAIDVQNARGKTIIGTKARTNLTGYTLEVVFAEVDPGLFEIVTGQRILYNEDGEAVGFAVNTSVDLSNRGWGLEVWAGATGGDACDDEDAEGGYGYFLYPFIKGGILGDHTIENGGITFTITGATTQDGNRWGVGPYDVVLNLALDPEDPKVAGPLWEPLEVNDHEILIPTSVAPPTPALGGQPLLDPTWAAIVTITETIAEDSFVADLVVTPDPTEGGVLWDFGDGTWDFVDAPGDATHDYTTAGAGDYTVRASTNGTWITKVITVPGV
jgi:hypothetical protein